MSDDHAASASIGATGLVGTEMLRILEERSFPVDELRAYASPRSEGRKLAVRAAARSTCEVLRDGCFDGLDLVIVDVDDPLALEWAPQAAAAGARVIDNSAAFRMDPDVPLVVAEVNPDDLRTLPKGIASCPNCTTMVLVTALAPLHRAARIDRHGRVDVSVGLRRRAGRACTSSTRSGRSSRAGPRSCAARARSTRRSVEGEVWPKPIAGNVIPLAGSVKEAGLHVGGVEDRPRDAQDPPRRRHPRAPSPACGCRCTSATRCRRTSSSTAR